MAINCVYRPERNQFGYSSEVWNRLKEVVGEKVPTRGKFTNIVRNLGLDDTRMVNLKDQAGKRFFGKNITDVTDLDMTKRIPQDTMVRVPSRTGERYYVANKQTDLAPSRWVLDENNGDVRMNPDWDQLGVNVTGMKRYTRGDDGVWREATTADGEGSFLNIQNPSKVNYGQKELIDRGIDAIEVDGGYRLVDESAQAVNARYITDKPQRASNTQTKVTEAPDANDVAGLMSQYNIPHGVASAVAGGLVGNFVDSNDEFAGTFWGGALGLMLGSPRVRGKIKGVYNRTNAKGSDEYDRTASSLTEQERTHTLRERAKIQGYKGDLTDGEEVEKFLRFAREQQQAKENFTWGFGNVFKNQYFESGEGFFKSMGGVGKELFTIMRGFESAPRKLHAQFSDIQSRIFGDSNTKQIFKQTQIDFVRRLDPNRELSDEQALQSFGSAVKRLITHRGRIEDGQFRYEDTATARIAYAEPEVQRIDRAILEDEQARGVYESVYRYFNGEDGKGGVGKQALDTIDSALTRELDSIGDPRARDILDRVNNSGMTFKQWKGANPNEAKYLDLLKEGKFGDHANAKYHSKQIATVKALIEDRQRFTQLQGRYFPQKFSQVKEARERRAWEQRNRHNLSDKDSEQVTQLWEQHKASQILSNNKEKWRALEINEDGMDVNTKVFGDRKQARNYLMTQIDEIQDSGRREAARGLANDPQTLDEFFVRRPKQGGGYEFELTTPERYRNEDMFPNGMFEKKNLDITDRANRSYVSLNVSKNADHFDRPRNMDIPSRYLETDIEQLTKFYADDMGIRLHAVKHGLYDSFTAEKNWIRPIREDLAGRVDPHRLETMVGQAKSWFALMQGTRAERKVGLTEADRQTIRTQSINQAKNDTFLNSAAKVATASFNYGTTLYSMFTPMVLGPFITSYRSVLSQYKNGLLSPRKYSEDLKRFTDEIEKMGVIQKKFESYAPEYKRQYRDELLGDPSGWMRKFADFSDNATDFTANLSFARMLKIDPENLGIARLAVGNMLDISGAEAGMVTMAAFRHIEDLLGVAKQIKKSGSGTLRGTRYTQSTLDEAFERLGVSNPRQFVEGSEKFDKFYDYMKGNATRDNFDSDTYAQMTGLVNTIIDQYHGRTKMSRPLKWMDNVWGRALSRYSVYAQNFGVQTTANRIYRPMKDWSDRYPMNDESVPMFKLAYWASTGNDAGFKRVFGDNWEQAYNDFPVESVNNFFKVFGALGVGHAMMITRGGILDLTEIATNEALGRDDYDAWRSVNRQLTLGTYADSGDEFTIADVFSGDVQGYDLFKMFTGQLAQLSRLGFGGRYTQVFTDDLRYTQGGIAEMTPVTGLPNDLFERAGSLLHNTNKENLPTGIARETLDFITLRGTPFGTFAGMREGIVNSVVQKPQNRNIRYVDAQSGTNVNVNLYEP